MVLTDTGRLGAGPSSGQCTGSVLTPSEDVGGITTVVNSLWKSYAIPKFISIGQGTRILAYHIYNISTGRCRKDLVELRISF